MHAIDKSLIPILWKHKFEQQHSNTLKNTLSSMRLIKVR